VTFDMNYIVESLILKCKCISASHFRKLLHNSYEVGVDGYELSDELLHSTTVISSHRPA